MVPLISLIFRRNDIAEDFRKARKDPVEWEDWFALGREDNKILNDENR